MVTEEEKLCMTTLITAAEETDEGVHSSKNNSTRVQSLENKFMERL